MDDDFDDVFRSLYPGALRVALRILREPADAEDAVAEAFARALMRWRRVAALPYRDAWILSVTANVSIDIARHRRRNPSMEQLRSEEPDVVDRLMLVEALRALPRRQREVVVLRYLAGLSVIDVGAYLSIAPSSVKEHASRAMTALRERLGPALQEAGLVHD